MLTVDSHPLLDLKVFTTTFPRPLGELKTPPAVVNALFDSAPTVPITADDPLREAVRAILRHGGFRPAGRSKPASEYLRQLYFDSIIFTPEGLRHLVAECGASQIMLGTDYPFPWSTTTVDQVFQTPGLSDAERRAILGETAARLLKIKV